jgi:3-oxoacid CoA-transferase
VALVRAWKVDEAGNAVFRYTAHNFSSAMARSATVTIVEVSSRSANGRWSLGAIVWRLWLGQAEEIVPIGSLDPNEVHLPGIYVDRIVKAETEKEIEFVTLAPEPGEAVPEGNGDKLKRELIAKVRPAGRGSGAAFCLPAHLARG